MSLCSQQPTASTREEGGVCVVTFVGALNNEDGGKLIERTIQDHIDKGCKCFLLDMERVGWISDSSLGACAGALKKVTDLDGNMAFLNPAASVAEVLRCTCLDKVFSIYTDEATALARIREDRLGAGTDAKTPPST